MKKYLLGILSLIAFVIASAFTMAVKKEDAKSVVANYFYRYTSGSTAQVDIQNIANYQRVDASCAGGEKVCGVYLATNKPIGSQPVPAEFNAVKSQLWASEQANAATIPTISMKE